MRAVVLSWVLLLAACRHDSPLAATACYQNYWSSTNGGPVTCVIVPVPCPAAPPVCS